MKRLPLRIGIVVPRFAPYRGGLETYVASAASALAAKGAEVTVITQAPRAAALPRREMRDGCAIERHHLPVSDVFDLPSLSAARSASRRGCFDVLWVHSYHTPLAWLAAEQARAPIVFTPHYHGVGHTPIRQVLHHGYRPLGRRLMTASRRIVVDTDAEADLLLRDFPQQVAPSKVTVVPPVVADPRHGLPPYSGESSVVLTVARQETYKRTDLLVRAVAGVHDRGVPVRLVVVGEGAARTACQELAGRLRIDDLVTFTGAVDDATLGRWWASASVYATASLQEAYGIGLAEALVAGLPVVASDIPAHREVARRAGPDAMVRLCTADAEDVVAASRYTDALVELLTERVSCSKRERRCALPSAAEVVDQLLVTLTDASERARL